MRDGVDAAAADDDDNYYTGIKRSLLFACVCFYFLCRTGLGKGIRQCDETRKSKYTSAFDKTLSSSGARR